MMPFLAATNDSLSASCSVVLPLSSSKKKKKKECACIYERSSAREMRVVDLKGRPDINASAHQKHAVLLQRRLRELSALHLNKAQASPPAVASAGHANRGDKLGASKGSRQMPLCR